jgi:undecaprenyl diphosphate synthase
MKYPRHLAIIADGNRTWAKEQWLPAMDGHFAGAKKTLEMMEHIFTTTPIDILTWRFLSTENLKNRSPEEVAAIFTIIKALGNDMDPFLLEHRINFQWIGNRNGMPHDVVEFLDNKTRAFTFTDSPKTCVFALNYGGRDEIIRWIQSLSEDDRKNLTEDSFAKHLDFGKLPPLEMVIRTKGDRAHRTSGFMSWWIGYAELYFAKEYYPGMTREKIDEALVRYDSIAEDRNFGK